MTREVSDDFRDYREYLKAYNFAPLLGDGAYINQIRQVHSAFLALLTVCSELTADDGDLRALFESEYGVAARGYLQEVVSDVGQSAFCLGSGAYKASLVTLRSSIESFAKTFSLKERPDILTQKAVYVVFDIAKGSNFFKDPLAVEPLARLLQIYDELNLYVHTVTNGAMFAYLRLGVFPQFEPGRAGPTANYFLRVTNAMLVAIVMVLRPWMFKLHHRNRETILSGLSAVQVKAFNQPI